MPSGGFLLVPLGEQFLFRGGYLEVDIILFRTTQFSKFKNLSNYRTTGVGILKGKIRGGQYMIKKKFWTMYMKMAQISAEYSSARRAKVGTIIVKEDRILSVGINGTPSGWETNECEYTDENGALTTKPEVLHSEANAITKLAKSTESGTGASLFVTHAPCLSCAKLIVQAGIAEVFYYHSYNTSTGTDFLKKCKINVKQLDNLNN